MSQILRGRPVPRYRASSSRAKIIAKFDYDNTVRRLQLDPFLRQSMWAGALGLFCSQMMGCGLSQSMMQRYLALPDIHKAKR